MCVHIIRRGHSNVQVSKLFNLEEVLDELSTQGSCNKDEQGGERMVVADSASQDSQAPQGGKVRG